MDHSKVWKILKEKGVLEHLTCLLRLGGQEPSLLSQCLAAQSQQSAPNPVPVVTACTLRFAFVFGVFLVNSAEFLVPTERMSFERGTHLIHIFVGPVILLMPSIFWIKHVR